MRYVMSGEIKDVSEALERVLCNHIDWHVGDAARQDGDEFRSECCYVEVSK